MMKNTETLTTICTQTLPSIFFVGSKWSAVSICDCCGKMEWMSPYDNYCIHCQ